ncbi:MAG: hypothetical protein IT373_38075 [Polyangiaceae bacterium]|nr:hypothetical protein [Polyangiaceae bacterium]
MKKAWLRLVPSPASARGDPGLSPEARLEVHMRAGVRAFLALALAVMGAFPPVSYLLNPAAFGAVLAPRLATMALLVACVAATERCRPERLSALAAASAVLLTAEASVEQHLIGELGHVYLAAAGIYPLGLAAFVPVRARPLAVAGVLSAAAPLLSSSGEDDLARHAVFASYAVGATLAAMVAAARHRRILLAAFEAEATVRLRSEELRRAAERQQRVQTELAVAERLALLGRLAAGVAHEVNTPLAAVQASLAALGTLHDELARSIGHADVTEQDLREIAAEAAGATATAAHAVERAAGYVRALKHQTRTLGRPDEREVNLAVELEHLASLLRHGARAAGVGLEIACEPGLRLHGDPGKLAQILTNLVTNAVDACAGRATPPVRVEARRERDEIAVYVRDAGPGVPAELQKRLFEPFFTTKSKGSGLGLALSRDLAVGAFGGSLSLCDPVAGVAGATFVLRVPVKPQGIPHGDAI